MIEQSQQPPPAKPAPVPPAVPETNPEDVLPIYKDIIVFTDPAEQTAAAPAGATSLGSIVDGASANPLSAANAVRAANAAVLPSGAQTGNSWNFFQTVDNAVQSVWN